MKQFLYKKINAFTGGKSKGNPAAFLMLGEEQLTDQEYLEIGKDHKGFVSEVVFCSSSSVADCKLTYYSSECEVDFCGHGTIATMYDLIKNDAKLLVKKEITIETNKKANLILYNHMETEDVIYITAPEVKYLQVPVDSKMIAQALATDESVMDSDTPIPIECIDAGLKTLLVPIKTLEKVITIVPNENTLKTFCLDNEIDIILLFSKEASTKEFFAHTRVFAPKFGYLEDPATGSGNSAFGYYLLKNRLWDGEPISIEQGGKGIEYNTVKLNTKGDKVLFGGRATVCIEGTYIIQ